MCISAVNCSALQEPVTHKLWLSIQRWPGCSCCSAEFVVMLGWDVCLCVCSFHTLSRSQTFHSDLRLRKQLLKNKENGLICFSGSPILEP